MTIYIDNEYKCYVSAANADSSTCNITVVTKDSDKVSWGTSWPQQNTATKVWIK